MPVILVFAAALPDDQVAPSLAAVNRAAAEALGLAPHDVHTMLVPATHAATGDAEVAPWPTAVLHGRERPGGAMALATRAVALVLGDRWSCPVDEVWVQWATAPGWAT